MQVEIPLQIIHSEEGPHYRLGAKREQESYLLTSDNQPLFTSSRSSGDSMLGLYCVAWLTQESVNLRIFVRKKGMTSPTDVHSRCLPQGSERRKLACSTATSRFPRASCF